MHPYNPSDPKSEFNHPVVRLHFPVPNPKPSLMSLNIAHSYFLFMMGKKLKMMMG